MRYWLLWLVIFLCLHHNTNFSRSTNIMHGETSCPRNYNKNVYTVKVALIITLWSFRLTCVHKWPSEKIKYLIGISAGWNTLKKEQYNLHKNSEYF